MRAAIIPAAGAVPELRDFPEPAPADGAVLINVRTAGLGGMGAAQLGAEYPCVIRGEGVGFTDDGTRVYFGERSVAPFGAWAERTVVPAEEVWEVPDDIDDRLAITLGIAGTGALVPLDQANIQPGENVLILGATGALGQVALQLARHLGAGRVVAAGRDEKALNRVVELGLADDAVRLGTDGDAAALKAAGGAGFDVVLDVVYGNPFVAALKATREGARIMTISAQAGLTATVSLPDLLFRTHTCVGTGQRPPADRRAIWLRLLDIARETGIVVDYLDFPLDQVTQAWNAQAGSPHAKIITTIPATAG